jgi:trimeric autotransporter adhesin
MRDGTFDMQAAIATGLQGSLDLRGYRVQVEEATGRLSFEASADEDGDIDGRGPSNLDGEWWDGFAAPGTDGSVRAIAAYRGTLVVGGWFHWAGDTQAQHIAQWDGERWTPLGDGVDGAVLALMVYGSDLIVGGQFSLAGGLPIAGLARWNGSAWSDVGNASPDHAVASLVVYDGDLVAAGYFNHIGGIAASRIARWDGKAWSSLGAGTSGHVFALVVHDQDLIAGGAFTSAGGRPALHVARWDGVKWSALGAGLPTSVNALEEFRDELTAGTDSGRVYRWVTGVWGVLGATLAGPIQSLHVQDDLLFAGCFPLGPSASGIQSWNGSSWAPLGAGVGGWKSVEALGAWGDRLIVGGDFSRAGGQPVSCLAVWQDGSWSPLGSGRGLGMDLPVAALAEYGGRLIAGGWFGQAGGVDANHIARWNGQNWEALGWGTDGCIRALAVWEGLLIAGGDFTRAGGQSASGIASWDGTAWSPIGGGLGGSVRALAVCEGRLIAGGKFTSAGGTPVNRIAAWDGMSWSGLGSGVVGDPTFACVHALLPLDEKLYVGGSFWQAGDVPANGIARWNGQSWEAVGSGTDGGDVMSMTADDGDLILGGVFDFVDGVPAHNVARLTAQGWQPLGLGLRFMVAALAVHEGHLLAGGCEMVYVRGRDEESNTLMRWDGSTWVPFGSGVHHDIYALSVCQTSPAVSVFDRWGLFAGGYLTRAGGHLSQYIGLWTGTHNAEGRSATCEGGLDEQRQPPPGCCMERVVTPAASAIKVFYTLTRPEHVHLTLHDLTGRCVERLDCGPRGAGQQSIEWCLSGDSSSPIPPGLYLLRIQLSSGETSSRKVAWLGNGW